ncbi:MAG TPA: cren protein [Desulfurococcales archaeon]|nr:cren protein [Desulfurococcales archaeon]
MPNSISEKALAIRVNSLNDIARFAATISTLGQPIYILRFKVNGKYVYGILAVFRDYYKYYGIPLFYYYVTDRGSEHERYLLIRTDETGERVELSKGVRPGWVAIPIITLTEKPEFIDI